MPFVSSELWVGCGGHHTKICREHCILFCLLVGQQCNQILLQTDVLFQTWLLVTTAQGNCQFYIVCLERWILSAVDDLLYSLPLAKEMS